MNIFVNEILVDYQTKKRYRVLWITNSNKFTYIIDIDEKKALPVLRSVSDILEEILEEIIYKEKSTSERRGDGKISERAIIIRDEAWQIIKEVINKEPDIYLSEKRGKIIQEIMIKHQTTKPTIYKHLRRYWQRGKTPNALIPDYMNSGGKGKSKQPAKKMGRVPKFKEVESNLVVDESIKKIFRLCLQSYYFNQKKNSLPFAYKMMIRKYFLEDIYFEDGQEKVILKDKSELPTIHQFRYFLRTEYSDKQKLIPRISLTKYQQNFREILGSSTFETFGPGSRFQIDATIADVYVVSEYNSDWIIGRPIIYFVVDVFSRMIVGIYIGLEGPSWMGGMMAIANTVTDKQTFCAEYGIDISIEQWPCEHLPQILLADRGEFEGYNVERLNNAFNLQVENAAPYRPDWKGIVEKYFNVFQGRIKPFLPGYVEKDFKERGTKDYRLDAKLNIKDFTKIMIAEVIFHNNHHYLKNYKRDKEMITDDVQPIPIELWNWGIKNRSGQLTYHSTEKVKLHLLPQASATVTERGIRFKKMHYMSQKAMKETWFATARIKGSWKVKISYDPRDMGKIYLLSDDGMTYEECTLLDHEERFMKKSLEEINYLSETEEYMKRKHEHRELKEEVNLISQIQSIVTSTVNKANKLQSKNISKAEKISLIRSNRGNEKTRLRDKEKFEIKSLEENGNNIIPDEKLIQQNFDKRSIKDILNKK